MKIAIASPDALSAATRHPVLINVLILGLMLSAGVARGQGFKVLHSFNLVPVGVDGALPSGDLIQATDGNIYGTISVGGANGGGVVYKMTAEGTLTPLHSFTSFDPIDGYDPRFLIQASDGDFYGTTYSGGGGLGTLFKMTAAGVITTLHVFAPVDGGPAAGPLIEAKDGNFYGTTSIGGPSLGEAGTIFRMTPTGVFTVLHAFPGMGTIEGRNPLAGLIQASDDDFYGTTSHGGANGYGTVFKMDAAGTTVTTLHSFIQTGGAPNGSHAKLLQAADTNLYGTTFNGGAFGTGMGGFGTVFKLDTHGTTYVTLHSFAGTDGKNPAAHVIQARDGNFYGTTSIGGPTGGGSVFRMDASGTVTLLHSFAFSDGFQPLAGVLQATNGKFYGTTQLGGAGYGVVFRIDTTTVSDLDGDFKTDRTVFRPSAGIWYSLLSSGTVRATAWGVSTDVDVAADYDGDGKADLAVWRPSTGQWFIIQSSTGTVRIDSWGVGGDIPLAGDVDGDGKADLVIWRPGTGTWYAKKSTGGVLATLWGVSGDTPLVADFDGDGKADLAIYRPTAGAVWYVVLSSGGFQSMAWGLSTDIPVAGDWDGDGLADAGIFRPSTGQWFILKSSGGAIGVGWGVAGDVPVSGDHDGDGRSDYIVWRPSTGVWYTQFATGGSAAVTWGTAGDRPVGRAPGT